MIDGTNIKQRDLVLVQFPFSDFTESKKRPAIVISNSLFHNNSEDILVCGVTSKITHNKSSLRLEKSDMESGNLDLESEIRFDKITFLKKELLQNIVGKISKNKFSELYNKILDVITPRD